MTVTLLMAITTNGYIAGLDDDTNWIKDTEALYITIAEFGNVIIGKRTYDECIKYDAFPYKNALNVVMTHRKELLAQSSDTAIFTDKSPREVLELVKAKGFENILLIGGGKTNGSFIKENLIDEVILDIHPLIKSQGIHLFESQFADVNLELVKFQKLADDLLQVTYRVKR